MNSKQNRISEISHIIESEVVRSQQDIISRLSERGIEVTQASLSRYLKEIQASRIPDGAGGYIYKLPDGAGRDSVGSDFGGVCGFVVGGDTHRRRICQCRERAHRFEKHTTFCGYCVRRRHHYDCYP